MNELQQSKYPIRIRGELDFNLKRGLWLVKWFLAIPHLIVLCVLWIAVVITTVIAGFAILFTGKYPRSIFDFNVGVLRWGWRVTFYAFNLGTDRYPPFSLRSDSTYPADLDVDYPQHLSQGLVVVKWWLLAIPQYCVVAIFSGGFKVQDETSIGLVGLLSLFAGVSLLFTRRYPLDMFNFIMGMQRWTYRVIAYALLMTDKYPPFRIELGPDERPIS